MIFVKQKELTSTIIPIMKKHGFVRRGSAFFRIIGDGVMQIIAFVYEYNLDCFSLEIGFHSLYSELLPQWFTSNGCIPKYSVANFIGQRSIVRSLLENGDLSLKIMSPEEQINILETIVFARLNDVRTQKQLVTEMCNLEKQGTGSVYWLDSQKIAPFLAIRDYESAEKVINHILQQHAAAYSKIWTPLPWTENDYKNYCVSYPKKDQQLLRIHRWISEQNEHAIQNYLQSNYAANISIGRFCMATE